MSSDILMQPCINFEISETNLKKSLKLNITPSSNMLIDLNGTNNNPNDIPKKNFQKIKLISKKFLDSNTSEILSDYLFKKDVVTLDEILNVISEKNYRSDKILATIFRILEENKVTISMVELGSYPTMYVYDNFKKSKDNSFFELIKNKINKELKEVNRVALILLLEKLILRDFKFRENILKYFNIDPNFSISEVPEEDIIKKEVYIILFFYFKMKNEENLKFDFSSNYLTKENLSRLFDPLRYLNNIRNLDIANNRISAFGMYSLGIICKYNFRILELDISNNYLNNYSLFCFLLGLGYYQPFKIEEIFEKKK